jgi:putative drug exporter of the RND superfamily
MLTALADAALSRPRAVLGATIAVLAGAAALAVATVDRLALAPLGASGSESERTADELAASRGHEPAPGLLLVTRGREKMKSSVYRVALDVISSQAETNPEVAEVRRGPVSRDGRTSVLAVYFRDDDPGAQRDAASRLESELDPGPLEVLVGGQVGTLSDARDGLWGELGLLELLALPIAVLVLMVAFGPRLAAGPVLAAAIGVLGSVGMMALVDGVTTVSISGIAPAAVVAIGLGIESCRLLFARYRDAAAILGSGEVALRRTLDTAGRAVVLSTIAATVVAATVAVIPVLDARSAALGCGLAAILSGAVSLAAVPALLVLSAPTVARAASIATPPQEGRGIWYRVEAALTGRAWIAALLVVLPAVALVVVALPSLLTDTVPLDAAGLPDDSSAHRAEVRVASELGSATTAPVLVPIARDREDVRLRRMLRAELARVSGVAEMGGIPQPGLLSVGTDARPGSLGARDTVEAIRSAPPTGASGVAGRDAEALDANRALFDRLPIAAGLAALLLAALLVVFVFRGVLSLPRAIISAAVLAIASKLPAAAAGGLLVLVFQDGRLIGPLGYTPEGGPELVAVLCVLTAVATVSAGRTVHFAATIAAQRELGFEARERVPRGGALTLPGVAASTAVLAAATVVLAGSDLVAAKEFGLATAAGLTLDFLLLRVLLAPGLARLSQ